jgi:ATP-dependent RNA helicase DHX37/DHR1
MGPEAFVTYPIAGPFETRSIANCVATRIMTDHADEVGVRKRPRVSKDELGVSFVRVARDPVVQQSRMKLPVCMYEQEIVEAIRANDIVLVTGETGTGKTTQVPQFLVESGFGDKDCTAHCGLIAVTQPRRIAATSCARRVAHEMGSPVGELVGFHVRHSPVYCSNTKIKFVTDGILLREIQDDLTLERYSAIVIDEAHERTLNTDLLLALLSRTVVLRRQHVSDGLSKSPLKLVIMSATLDIDGVFTGSGSLFPRAVVVHVPARQYPVTVHFERHTSQSYVDA